MRVLFDADGKELTLGQKLAEGGEGAIFNVAERSDVVAKIYLARPEPQRIQKLRAMRHVGTPALLKIAAWPVSPLLRPQNGEVVGFVMPRVKGREAHILYGPRQRQAEFPFADWRFLVRSARNAAAAVATVHAAGHVIGDVNQKGFLVNSDATVRLIDCDSFQIVFQNRRFPCVVGVPEFTPPELHGKPLNTVIRTPNHDAFGLAVLIFQVMFMGRHPFAGRYTGHGNMPPDRAIREHRFAFSQSAASRQMLPPPHSLSLAAVPYAVASLFERAFSAAGAHGSRPNAQEWVAALERLEKELKACEMDRAHWYYSALKTCPWCTIERGGGPAFFLSVTPAVPIGKAASFDVTRFWASVQAIPVPWLPSSPPRVTASSVSPRPIPRHLLVRRRLARILGTTALLVGMIALAGVLPETMFLVAAGCALFALIQHKNGELNAERATRKAAFDAAQRQWDHLESTWLGDARQIAMASQQRRSALEKLVIEYRKLPELLQKERANLEKRREELQRKAFLERYYIRDADLEGIGEGLKSTLISYGIETAYDINPRVRVLGIGPKRMGTLLAWRYSVEARFRFAPKQGIQRTEIAALNHKFALRQKDIERQLVQGKAELEQLRRRFENARTGATSRIDAAARQLAQAKADYEVAR